MAAQRSRCSTPARARLAKKPLQEVAFAALRTGASSTKRELALAEMLGETGFAPAFVEALEHPDMTFLATESPGYLRMDIFVEESMSPGHPATEPVLSVDKFLSLSIDLLRAFRALEEGGVVYGDFDEEHVFVVDDGARAMITGFRTSCLCMGGNAELGCLPPGGEPEGVPELGFAACDLDQHFDMRRRWIAISRRMSQATLGSSASFWRGCSSATMS